MPKPSLRSFSGSGAYSLWDLHRKGTQLWPRTSTANLKRYDILRGGTGTARTSGTASRQSTSWPPANLLARRTRRPSPRPRTTSTRSIPGPPSSRMSRSTASTTKTGNGVTMTIRSRTRRTVSAGSAMLLMHSNIHPSAGGKREGVDGQPDTFQITERLFTNSSPPLRPGNSITHFDPTASPVHLAARRRQDRPRIMVLEPQRVFVSNASRGLAQPPGVAELTAEVPDGATTTPTPARWIAPATTSTTTSSSPSTAPRPWPKRGWLAAPLSPFEVEGFGDQGPAGRRGNRTSCSFAPPTAAWSCGWMKRGGRPRCECTPGWMRGPRRGQGRGLRL